MNNSPSRTFVCSVLFLDIVEYSKKSVTEQLRLKQRFNAFLVTALQQVAVNDRIVLDTGDGAAVSFLGSPEDPLFIAIALRDAIAAENPNETPPLLVRIGINLGPVRLIKDINGQLNIIGDGINVAERVMSFGEPGSILVSRSYHEVVSRLSDDYVQIFQDAGTRTDKHVREHSVFAVGALPRHMPSSLQPIPGGAGEGWHVRNTLAGDSSAARSHMNHRVLAGVSLIALAIVGIGWMLRMELSRPPAEIGAITSTSGKMPRPAAPIAKTTQPTAASTAAEGRSSHVSPEEAKLAAAKGTVRLMILPWGEIYVDGRKRGVSPPLKVLSLSPGVYRIEVRNSSFPVYKETVVVKSGATLKVRHKF
jgi:class 3 adenylate cyclase